jgi:uncharacterized protein (TIGR03435 family)
MLKAAPAFLLTSILALTASSAYPQSAPANPPSFEVATIKPPDPKASFRIVGFDGRPGGRVHFGGNIKMLVEFAFNLRDNQVEGGPNWMASQWFEINAVPPESSPSRHIQVANAEPTPEQRLMLKSLLIDRFGLKFHLAKKEGEVYILTRGTKPLHLKPPKDPTSDPRAIVVITSDGIDGEASGTNTTTDYMAQRFADYLQLPVVNQTGITGSYDYDLPPDEPENDDITTAVLNVVDRLGLKLKRGRGPVQSLIIDNIEQPSAN